MIVRVPTRSILDFQNLVYRHNPMAKNGIYPLIERVFDDYNLIQPMLFDPVYNNANDMYTSTQAKFIPSKIDQIGFYLSV